MSKTYTFNATAKGGTGSWSGDWNNFYNQASNQLRVGQVGSSYLAVYYTFNKATDNTTTYASVRSKTITGVTLSVPITSTGNGVPSSGSEALALRAKNTPATGSGSGSTAWQSTGSNLGFLRQPVSSGRVSISPSTQNSLPENGYVVGAAAQNVTFVEVGAAVLTVTTNENDYSYTLAYNVNGGSGSFSNQTGSNTGTSPSYTFTISSASPTRTGYTFLGWSTSSTATSASYSPGGSITVTQSGTTTLYAVWKILTYTITYNKGSASGATGAQQTATKTYGSDLTLPNAIFTRTGYSQTGWSTAAAGNSKAYELGGKYTNNANATLYPYWTANTYAVTYNANGGSGTTASQTKTYGVALTLRANGFTRTGYSFQSWNTKADGTGTSYAASSSYTANAALTLYAIWQASVSTVSTTNGTLGTAQTITITRSSTSYTHKLSCTYGTKTLTNFATGVGTSYSWTPPASLAEGFPNASSGTCTITCVTMNGSTTVGSSTTTCTLAIPNTAAYKPSIETFTAAHHSSNSAVDGSAWGGTYTKGYSYATLSVANGYTLRGGATLKSIAFSGPGISSSGTATSANTSVLTAAYPNNGCTWTVTVTDSRDRTATATISKTVYDYAPPVVSGIAVARCDNDPPDYTVNNASGLHFRATPSYGFSSVAGNNQLRVHTIQYRVHPSGAWSTAVDCTSGSMSGPWSSLLTNAYDVMVTLSDEIQYAESPRQYTTFMTTLPTVQGVWIGKGNDRLGLGGVPPSAGLHCDWYATFNGVLDVTPRRCYATLSSAGWYRVLVFNSDSVNHSNGYAGSTIDFNIGYKGQNETHKISLHIVNGRIKFDSENSVYYSQHIDKIRYTINGAVGYVDLHILGACNGLYVDFIVHDQPTKQYQYVAASLSNVDPSPSDETIVVEYTFSGTAYNKTVSAEGTANGWDYILYTDKTIDATRNITDTVSNYTTVNGFYGYYIANIATPFTMANTNYYIGTEWAIGTGFSVPAAVMIKTTTKFNAYALGTASGSQSVSLTMHIKGTIA